MALTYGTITADFTLVIANEQSTGLQGYADLTPNTSQVSDGESTYVISKLRCPIVNGILRNPGDTADNVSVVSSDHDVTWRIHVEIPGYRIDSRLMIVASGQTLDYVDGVPGVAPSIPPVYAAVLFDTDGTPYLAV